jgi:hypothetical protein
VLSTLIVLAWKSGNPGFVPRWKIILDVSPWALTFYTMTLIGASLNSLWPRLSIHPLLGGSLIGVALAVGVYSAFIVIWRHRSDFQPGWNVYLIATFLLIVAVIICHNSSSKQQGP